MKNLNNNRKRIIVTMLIVVSVWFFGVNVSWAAEDRQIQSGVEFGLLSEETNFSLSEEVEFDFEIRKKRTGINKIGAWFKGLIIDEYENTRIESKIIGLEAKTQVEYDKNGKFKISLIDTSTLQPGKHKIEVTIQDNELNNGEIINFAQDFTWGVLAYNSNKSVYMSGENAYLQFAVLDDNGNTLCGADLEVTIDEPGWGKKVLSTKDGSIARIFSCQSSHD